MNMLSAIAKGMFTTFKHMFRKEETVPYPEERLPVAPRFRGRHFLVVDDNGLERCIFCGYCEEACPEDAIFLGKEYELECYTRDGFIYDKAKLNLNVREAAKQRPEVLHRLQEDLSRDHR